ncbi:MAG: serine hydrolase domain-containing protein [Candidatus Spyradocola sp.]
MRKPFETATPESLGISSRSILAFIRRAQDSCIEMHKFAILRHGKLAAKGCWAPYQEDVPHAMFSFSKTLTATAIGFAEQEGILTLDEKLVDLFPDECPADVSENLAKADVRSLLTMSCGHETESPLRESPDWIRAFLAHEFKYEPGTMFQYNTLGTNMLAAILYRKTGCSLTQFLKPRLFDPLGMSDAFCSVMPDGVIQRGGSGFKLTLEDMMRFTQFFLQKGKWDGVQLLREDWIARASAAQIGTVNPVFTNHDSNWRLGYGYQMWRCIPEGVYRADGAYGQFGIVIPDKDAVIVINSASTYPDDLLNIAWDTLLAGMADAPLPEDAQAQADLAKTLSSLTLPTLWGVRSRALEQQLAGVRFAAADMPNLLDFIGGAGKRVVAGGEVSTLTFAFDADGVNLTADGVTLRAPFNGAHHIQCIDGMHYAATAAWMGEYALCIDARNTESASGSHLCFRFDDAGVTVERSSTLPTSGWDGEVQNTYRLTRA